MNITRDKVVLALSAPTPKEPKAVRRRKNCTKSLEEEEEEMSVTRKRSRSGQFLKDMEDQGTKEGKKEKEKKEKKEREKKGKKEKEMKEKEMKEKKEKKEKKETTEKREKMEKAEEKESLSRGRDRRSKKAKVEVSEPLLFAKNNGKRAVIEDRGRGRSRGRGRGKAVVSRSTSASESENERGRSGKGGGRGRGRGGGRGKLTGKQRQTGAKNATETGTGTGIESGIESETESESESESGTGTETGTGVGTERGRRTGRGRGRGRRNEIETRGRKKLPAVQQNLTAIPTDISKKAASRLETVKSDVEPLPVGWGVKRRKGGRRPTGWLSIDLFRNSVIEVPFEKQVVFEESSAIKDLEVQLVSGDNGVLENVVPRKGDVVVEEDQTRVYSKYKRGRHGPFVSSGSLGGRGGEVSGQGGFGERSEMVGGTELKEGLEDRKGVRRGEPRSRRTMNSLQKVFEDCSVVREPQVGAKNVRREKDKKWVEGGEENLEKCENREEGEESKEGGETREEEGGKENEKVKEGVEVGEEDEEDGKGREEVSEEDEVKRKERYRVVEEDDEKCTAREEGGEDEGEKGKELEGGQREEEVREEPECINASISEEVVELCEADSESPDEVLGSSFNDERLETLIGLAKADLENRSFEGGSMGCHFKFREPQLRVVETDTEDVEKSESNGALRASIVTTDGCLLTKFSERLEEVANERKLVDNGQDNIEGCIQNREKGGNLGKSSEVNWEKCGDDDQDNNEDSIENRGKGGEDVTQASVNVDVNMKEGEDLVEEEEGEGGGGGEEGEGEGEGRSIGDLKASIVTTDGFVFTKLPECLEEVANVRKAAEYHQDNAGDFTQNQEKGEDDDKSSEVNGEKCEEDDKDTNEDCIENRGKRGQEVASDLVVFNMEEAEKEKEVEVEVEGEGQGEGEGEGEGERKGEVEGEGKSQGDFRTSIVTTDGFLSTKLLEEVANDRKPVDYCQDNNGGFIQNREKGGDFDKSNEVNRRKREEDDKYRNGDRIENWGKGGEDVTLASDNAVFDMKEEEGAEEEKGGEEGEGEGGGGGGEGEAERGGRGGGKGRGQGGGCELVLPKTYSEERVMLKPDVVEEFGLNARSIVYNGMDSIAVSSEGIGEGRAPEIQVGSGSEGDEGRVNEGGGSVVTEKVNDKETSLSQFPGSEMKTASCEDTPVQVLKRDIEKEIVSPQPGHSPTVSQVSGTQTTSRVQDAPSFTESTREFQEEVNNYGMLAEPENSQTVGEEDRRLSDVVDLNAKASIEDINAEDQNLAIVLTQKGCSTEELVNVREWTEDEMESALRDLNNFRRLKDRQLPQGTYVKLQNSLVQKSFDHKYEGKEGVVESISCFKQYMVKVEGVSRRAQSRDCLLVLAIPDSLKLTSEDFLPSGEWSGMTASEINAASAAARKKTFLSDIVSPHWKSVNVVSNSSTVMANVASNSKVVVDSFPNSRYRSVANVVKNTAVVVDVEASESIAGDAVSPSNTSLTESWTAILAGNAAENLTENFGIANRLRKRQTPKVASQNKKGKRNGGDLPIVNINNASSSTQGQVPRLASSQANESQTVPNEKEDAALIEITKILKEAVTDPEQVALAKCSLWDLMSINVTVAQIERTGIREAVCALSCHSTPHMPTRVSELLELWDELPGASIWL